VIRRDTRLGFWQAWIPAGSGGTVITRYLLQELLDKLEELVGAERSHGSGAPRAPGYSAGPGTDGQDQDR
jgi:hypothetical protein